MSLIQMPEEWKRAALTFLFIDTAENEFLAPAVARAFTEYGYIVEAATLRWERQFGL